MKLGENPRHFELCFDVLCEELPAAALELKLTLFIDCVPDNIKKSGSTASKPNLVRDLALSGRS